MVVSNITVLHLDAGHDPNGNPKRLYVLVKPGQIVAVVSEGYRGIAALDDAFGSKAGAALRKQMALTLAIPGKEYTALKRWASENGVLHYS